MSDNVSEQRPPTESTSALAEAAEIVAVAEELSKSGGSADLRLSLAANIVGRNRTIGSIHFPEISSRPHAVHPGPVLRGGNVW